MCMLFKVDWIGCIGVVGQGHSFQSASVNGIGFCRKTCLLEIFLKLSQGNTKGISSRGSSLLDQIVENSIRPLCHCSQNNLGSIDYCIVCLLTRSTGVVLEDRALSVPPNTICQPSAFHPKKTSCSPDTPPSFNLTNVKTICSDCVWII